MDFDSDRNSDPNSEPMSNNAQDDMSCDARLSRYTTICIWPLRFFIVPMHNIFGSSTEIVEQPAIFPGYLGFDSCEDEDEEDLPIKGVGCSNNFVASLQRGDRIRIWARVTVSISVIQISFSDVSTRATIITSSNQYK
jgi:hypothetical protein